MKIDKARAEAQKMKDQKGKRINMDMWKDNDILRIEVKNLPEFKLLAEQAKKEAQQLVQTLDKLSRFTIDIEFKTDNLKHEE